MKRDPDGFTHLGKDGVLRKMSKDYTVLDARGLTPDEIKEFTTILSHRMMHPDSRKELEDSLRALEGVDGSKVTSYEGLYNPKEGILPSKPSGEEAKRREEEVEKRNQEITEMIKESHARG